MKPVKKATTKKRRHSLTFRSLNRTSRRVLPVVNNGLQTVGKFTTSAVKTSIPVVTKGVAAVYGSMAKGFNLGVKGAQSAAKRVAQRRRSARRRNASRKNK